MKDDLSKLGYRLERCTKDFLGYPCRYRTLPIGHGGVTNYFADADAVAAYIKQVRRSRSWQVK
jgi:hypothetical protein